MRRTLMSQSATLLVVLCASALVVGCKHASVQMSDGAVFEGTIASGTPTAIKLTDTDGKEHELARDQITDISHPGMVELIAGGSLTAVGLGLLIPGAIIFSDAIDETTAADRGCGLSCEDPDNTDDQVLGTQLMIPGFILAATGIATAVGGVMAWTGSMSAADQGVAMQIAPTSLTDGEQLYQGAAFTLTW